MPLMASPAVLTYDFYHRVLLKITSSSFLQLKDFEYAKTTRTSANVLSMLQMQITLYWKMVISCKLNYSSAELITDPKWSCNDYTLDNRD